MGCTGFPGFFAFGAPTINSFTFDTELPEYQIGNLRFGARSDTWEAALFISREHRGPIDLLLADIAMIGMSGPQLAQCLRETRPALRLLFMSGLVTEKNFHGVLGAGFLGKPFTPAALVEKIEAALHPPQPSPDR